MHRANEIRPVLKRLGVIADKYQCAIILIDHMNKASGTKSTYRGLGSPEVYYRENDYENKLFMGILVSKEKRKYVIPLSSAKEKHKSWRDVHKDRCLVFEYAKEENMKRNDVWMSLDENVADKGDNNVKHILAAMDIKR